MERARDVAAALHATAALPDGDALTRGLLEAGDAQPIGAVEAVLGVAHARVVVVEAAAIEVGVAPAIPAEFIIFRVGKTQDRLEVTE